MSKQENQLYEFGEFRLDVPQQQLLHRGEPVTLTPKAFSTLALLVEQCGKLVEKEELMNRLWPDTAVEENNLNKNISAIRKALAEVDPRQTYIETVPTRGYRFVAPVNRLSDEDVELVIEKHTRTHLIAQEEEETNESSALEASHVLAPTSPKARLKLLRRAGLLALGGAALIGAGALVWLSFFSAGHSAAKPEMTVERLTYGGNVRCATLSPDGKYFVYEERDGVTSRLLLRQTEQANPLEIVPPAERIVRGTTFSPDGAFVYFVAFDKQDTRGALYRVPALGGPTTKLLTDIDSLVTFSPDGGQIAFVRAEDDRRATHLMVANANGGNERVLLSRTGVETLSGSGPSWSPDGKQIAVGLFTEPTPNNDLFCSIVGVDTESGATHPLTSQLWDQCGRVAWTGDGRGIVLIGTKRGESGTAYRDQVWYVEQTGGQVHRITTDLSRHFLESLGLTADSSALLVVPYNRTSQVWVMDAKGDSRTAVQLTSGTGDGRAGLSQLPDGRVIFIRRTGERLAVWQMNSDGTEQKQLTNDPPFLEELRATPDGRYLIFASNRAGRSHLFRVDADGSNLRQLTGGDSKEVDADCSPDGAWVVYASERAGDDGSSYGLWQIPIDGGAPSLLLEGIVNSPHFSPDGKYISYVYKDKDGKQRLAIISASGGAPLKTFLAPNAELGPGCQFTPDGQALTYLVTQKAATNIWLQPIDGGMPRPLTDFQSGEIYNYSFSRNGARLYLSRGYDIHDVTLIKNFSR